MKMAPKLKVVSLELVQNDINKSVKSFQLSKVYVKRFLKIGTLNIMYRRINIPDSEFEIKTYEGISYVVFKNKSCNKFIRNYHAFGHGILDALEKDYLKEIFMYIMNKTTNEILETYNFKIKYNKEVLKSDMKPSQVKKATLDFLHSLSDIPGKKWSMDDVELYMEFSYNDDTPREYEPPNFEAAKKKLCLGLHSKKIVQLGSVTTGYHKVSVWGRGKNFFESRASTPVTVDHVEEEEDNLATSNKENDRKRIKLDHHNNNSAFMNQSDDTSVDNISIVSSEESINCMCKWDLPKEFETTKCSKCYGIVHLACHGFLNKTAVDENTFKCFYCSGLEIKSSVMNRLMKLRIILYGIYLKKELPIELELASKEEKEYIMGQLDELGVYSFKGKGRGDIKINKLTEAIMSAFTLKNSQFLE